MDRHRHHDPDDPRPRRELVAERLAHCGPLLAREPAVAAALARVGIRQPVLVHVTYDDPLPGAGELETLFTYHLADAGSVHASGDREEVRGTGIALIAGTQLRFLDVEADIFRFVDDLELPGTD
jgi:hypothetical protein